LQLSFPSSLTKTLNTACQSISAHALVSRIACFTSILSNCQIRHHVARLPGFICLHSCRSFSLPVFRPAPHTATSPQPDFGQFSLLRAPQFRPASSRPCNVDQQLDCQPTRYNCKITAPLIRAGARLVSSKTIGNKNKVAALMVLPADFDLRLALRRAR